MLCDRVGNNIAVDFRKTRVIFHTRLTLDEQHILHLS